MAVELSERECVTEETRRWVWPRPVTFEEFLDLFTGRDEIVELIDGTVMEKEMVRLDHEKLLGWLYHVLALYVEETGLGIVLGSRTAVQIGAFRGRLPDLLFVRQDRLDTVHQKAVYGSPDLVVEVLSPGDRRSDVVALETDYRSIGVAEIVFLDQKRRRARVLRKRGGSYVEEEVTAGALTLESVEGLTLQLDWLFVEPRPTVRATLDKLLAPE